MQSIYIHRFLQIGKIEEYEKAEKILIVRAIKFKFE